ncbi:C/D box methylation guide ribonucleoprotein complex aNOP56 subunit [Candidatus Bathyarchaeota archaeon]|nr:MAG: C/D box methylation guide ribonucleoprotein complex aNOP56 subunit [Candidatus Bathyarchaeota archaeon]
MTEAQVMKTTIIACPFGILAFSVENELVKNVLFPKKPQIAAKTLRKIETGKMVDEIAELVSVLRENGYDIFVFENANVAKEVQERFGVEIELSKPSRISELRSSMERFAVETGFARDLEEFSRWIHDVTVEITKFRVKRAVENRDLIIAQAIQTLDDLDKTINLFMSRAIEWYGIHFPELDRLLDKHETYARLVFKLGNKDNFTKAKLGKENISKSKAQTMARSAETSMGADLAVTDLEQIRKLCKSVLGLYQLRQTLETYLDTAMEEVAPNMKAIVGSLIGARLIALAGGLMNLAKRPASTIQVLGAEKALFRSLKTGARPPKHGIIFQHTLLHEAKKWQRGKIARAVAGKLAIAARTDAFGTRYIGAELSAALKRRVEEIHREYVQPPQLPKRKHVRKKRRKKRRAHTR